VVLGLALLAGAAFFAVGDLRKFLAVASDVQPLWLLAAIGATLGAYVTFTGSLWSAAHIGGYKPRFVDVIPASFVSQAVNNLLSSGGLGGLAIRIYALGALGIPAGSAAAISAITTLSNDAVTTAGLIGGIVHLANEGDLSRRALLSIIAVLIVFLSAVSSVVIAIRVPRLRDRVLDFAGKYAARMARRLGVGGNTGAEPAAGTTTTGGTFRTDLVRVFVLAMAQPRRLLVPVAWMILDVTFRVACLGCAFAAIGHPQHPIVLGTGFMVGISAGAISLVPGGIGVVEGSMAAVFSFMGVELEVAAVAVIVFRLAFYVMPLGAVAIFFRPLLRRNALPAGQKGM
jgi:uncharacterized membrane protein YbhN (UPF0104 family)